MVFFFLFSFITAQKLEGCSVTRYYGFESWTQSLANVSKTAYNRFVTGPTLHRIPLQQQLYSTRFPLCPFIIAKGLYVASTIWIIGVFGVWHVSESDTNTTHVVTLNHFYFLKLLLVSMCQCCACVYVNASYDLNQF